MVWREGTVVSIPVGDGLFTLAQMLRSPYLCFFQVFRTGEDWTGVDLESAPVLFVRGVTRQFLRYAAITVRRDLAPASAVEVPDRWLQLGPGSQVVTAWRGAPQELPVMTLGEEGLRVIQKSAAGVATPLGPYLVGSDHAELDAYELDTLGVYPETIERLAICRVFGRNVDPDKDLICGRDLPPEYRSYFVAISS